MQEPWAKTIVSIPPMSWDLMLARLILAAILGGATAFVYARTHRRDETFTINFLATLVLLSILIAAVTQVIGDNMALAFSLVGALAIVRFRTVVEDTRDTAFVMLAVVLGMAAGTGHLVLAAATLGVSSFAALVLQPRSLSPAPPPGPESWSLNLRVGVGHDPEALVQAVFAKHLDSFQVVSAATARQGAALELTWKVVLRAGSTPAGLVAELNRLEGVQNVEVRR